MDNANICDNGSEDGKRLQDQLITTGVQTTRRSILGAICAVGMGSLAGCSQFSNQDLESSPTPTLQKEFPGGVLRCQGESISVEESLSASDEPIAYFPSNETVKYAAITGSGDVEVETMSYERWKVIKTARAAQNPVFSAVEDRIGNGVGGGLGRAPNAEGPSFCVRLMVTDPDAIEGTQTPPVTLQEVAETAPQSAHVTFSVDEELFSQGEISRAVPVFAEHHPPGRLG